MTTDAPLLIGPKLDDFLKEIPDGGGVGKSLRYERIYDQIRHARTDEDGALPQGVWKREIKRADWGAVEALCTDALINQSKDLQIAVWLTEAWLHRFGLGGLQAGLQLCASLLTSFWENIYPPLLVKDIEMRLSPLEWMNDKLVLSLRLIPLTNPPVEGARGYSLADWEAASHLENLSKMEKHGPQIIRQAEARGDLTLHQFYEGMHVTSENALECQHTQAITSIQVIKDLEAFVAERCPGATSLLNKMRETLENISRLLSSMCEKKRAVPTQEAAPPPPPAPLFDPGMAHAFDSRGHAYRMLQDVADFLRQQEPHSPTPYLVQRAIAWGQASSDVVLDEIQAQRDTAALRQLLGFPDQKQQEKK